MDMLTFVAEFWSCVGLITLAGFVLFKGGQSIWIKWETTKTVRQFDAWFAGRDQL